MCFLIFISPMTLSSFGFKNIVKWLGKYFSPVASYLVVIPKYMKQIVHNFSACVHDST